MTVDAPDGALDQPTNEATSRWLSAVHEAGHAVVGCALGLNLVALNISATVEHRGLAQWQFTDEDLERFAYDDVDALAAAHGATLWAGLLAQEVAGFPDDGGFGRPLDGRDGAVAGSDWSSLLDLAFRAGTSGPDSDIIPLLEAWQRLSIGVLDAHWDEVEAVAIRLHSAERLSPDEVAAIIATVDQVSPTMTEPEETSSADASHAQDGRASP